MPLNEHLVRGQESHFMSNEYIQSTIDGVKRFSDPQIRELTERIMGWEPGWLTEIYSLAIQTQFLLDERETDKPRTLFNDGKPLRRWTLDEDALVLDAATTEQQVAIAEQIDRTYAAVTSRRSTLMIMEADDGEAA